MTDKLTALLDEIEALEKAATPKEFWILDGATSPPYPTCYRSEPTWGGEPDKSGKVIHVQEITTPMSTLRNHATLLTGALRECLKALENIYKSAANGDGTTTECDIAYQADDALARVRGMVEAKK